MDQSSLPLQKLYAFGPPEVAQCAYKKWAVRGQNGDNQLTDWLEAEAELALLAELAEQVAESHVRLVHLLTETQERERRLFCEHAVSSILAISASLLDAAPKLLQEIGECLAWDFGAVWLPNRDTDLLQCLDVWRSPDIEVPDFERQTREQTFSQQSGLPGRVWSSQSVIWIADVSGNMALPRGPTAIREGLHCAIGFPLRSGTVVVGVLEFWSRDIRQPDGCLTEMFSTIERQIDQFIERREAERRLLLQEHDSCIARRIQQGFLPNSIPRLSGFEISGQAVLPEAVGGDCYDFVPVLGGDSDCLGVFIADAMGHGVAAGLLMAETRAFLRGVATSSSDVGHLLDLVNKTVHKGSVDASFVTALLIRLQANSRSLHFANAGHLPGYVIDSKGKRRSMLRALGLPLGLAPQTTYATSVVAIEPGDLILLMTDGIIESRSREGELFGIERALQIVGQNRQQSPGRIISTLLDAVRGFCSDRFDDDLTAVIVKVDGG